MNNWPTRCASSIVARTRCAWESVGVGGLGAVDVGAVDVVGADEVGEGGGLDDAGLGGRLAVPLPGTADEQAVSTASSAIAPVLIRPLSQSRSRAARPGMILTPWCRGVPGTRSSGSCPVR